MIELCGTERLTLELSGELDPALARALVPAGLEVDARSGGASVSLLLFDMKGLRARGLPGPALDYAEALWRVGVIHRGEPAWFAHTCDLDDWFVGVTGRLLVRYPVRRARLRFRERSGGCSVDIEAGAERFEVEASEEADSPPPQPPRPLLVRGGRSLFRIPWREDPAPFRRTAVASVSARGLADATLGPGVGWSGSALLHRGRIHRCGLAQRV